MSSKKRFAKAYVEITNQCNLRCAFCPGTSRAPRRMTAEEFSILAAKLVPYTDYLYLHLMGEPLSHPELEQILDIGTQLGFHLVITTNGTLLGKRGQLLLDCPAVSKISVSLHSFEANDGVDLEQYLSDCLAFAAQAGQAGKKCALRLWNLDGETTQGAHRRNDEILSRLEQQFPKPWKVGHQGTTLAPRVFLEWGEKFDWPDLSLPGEESPLFCRGLRDQIGVLADGTVVPCCLDHNGEIPLGNLFTQSMEEILSSCRANALYDGFSQRKAVEPLCRTCGYAKRF
jgi:radical SAM protein with 4Fe4S-binding SPASM domain